MGWKNVDTIIPGKLYLGKYVAYFPRDVLFPDLNYVLVSMQLDHHGR